MQTPQLGFSASRQERDGEVYNFSPGPAVIPSCVRQAAAATLADPGASGISILEVSHRCEQYESLHHQVLALCRQIYAVPEEMAILLLQGGASLQFTMVPQNLIRVGRSADYIETGIWSQRAIREVAVLGKRYRIAATSADRQFSYIPGQRQIDIDPQSEYVHITTNNTIYGTQFQSLPETGGVPIAADMSSDLLSRPVEWDRVGVAYGCAQKNAGIAGLTLVFIRKELFEREAESIPTMLRYSTHADDSLYNTPPVFAIYILGLVLQWIQAQGGIEAIHGQGTHKASILYTALDELGSFYSGYADVDSRSMVNITFTAGERALDTKFCTAADEAGIVGLAGHRSVGGVRASLYNGMPESGCTALAGFMRDFARCHG